MKKAFQIQTGFIALTSLIAISVPSLPTVASASIATTPRQQKNAYAAKRFKQMRAIPNKDQVKLIFLGDSITDTWSWPGARRGKAVWDKVWVPMHAANFGISGEETEGTLWRIDHGLFDGFHPKLIVLMIGTNNTGHRMEPAAETAAGVKMIVNKIKTQLPQTKILLLGVFPRGAKPTDPMRILNTKINDIIKNYADNKTVFYMNINKEFLEPDGTLSRKIFPDLLHPNEIGFKIWAKAIHPEVVKLMK